jgi:uncharacterized membrane protein
VDARNSGSLNVARREVWSAFGRTLPKAALSDTHTFRRHRIRKLSDRRQEALRTSLWAIPVAELLIAGALFAITYALDRAAFRGAIMLPRWVDQGSADAARQILTALAAAIITVVGLVFSIVIVALTLASTQFGPRMLRTFIRDRGVQFTLGTFVASFFYAILALGSVSHGSPGDFVPHLSVTTALGLTLVDLGVLVFFIHHIATSIQLPEVIAGIARDLSSAIAFEFTDDDDVRRGSLASAGSFPTTVAAEGAPIAALHSGYLQFVRYSTLVELATDAEAVIELLYRPGHFVLSGLPLARVWPASAQPDVARGLDRAHVTGANRTLRQDLAFAIDQLVEIAIRALSPAVNDTFTALTCVDWLSDGLCKITVGWHSRRVHFDASGKVRLIAAEPSYERFVGRAFDKIRQAGRAMPAIMIRQLDALSRIMEYTSTLEQRDVLLEQGHMILRSCEDSVSEPLDRADVQARYDILVSVGIERETISSIDEQ